MKTKEVYTKLFLVCVSEALAAVLTNVVSKYIIEINISTMSYIVFGAMLAFIVVYAYDAVQRKRRERIKQKLQQITDATLMVYNVYDGNRQQ